jgi:hypothetical protein
MLDLFQDKNDFCPNAVFLDRAGLTHDSEIDYFHTGNVSKGFVGSIKSQIDSVIEAVGGTCDNLCYPGDSSF